MHLYIMHFSDFLLSQFSETSLVLYYLNNHPKRRYWSVIFSRRFPESFSVFRSSTADFPNNESILSLKFVSQLSRVLPNFTSVSITRLKHGKHVFHFFLENTATQKKEIILFALRGLVKVNFPSLT